MKIFGRNKSARPPGLLPSGCFSVDRGGEILASTLPHDFPVKDLEMIAEVVLFLFRTAPEHSLPLSELHFRYEGITIKARELRGGAMVFLIPRDSLLS